MANKNNALTMGELEQIEDYADQPLSDLAEPGAKKMKLMTTIAWFVMKRSNPQATYNEAQALTQDQVTDLLAEAGLSGDSGE